MNQLRTRAVILARRNYREADRIVTAITPDYGKISLIAKGSRSLKSKLAGGIELFTVNDISFIKGRGEISTLVSSRLDQNFANIIKDINRVQLGYELCKQIDKNTEDEAEEEYFELLVAALNGLNSLELDPQVLKLWFLARVIAVSGHSPNLSTDIKGNRLDANRCYIFHNDSMSFEAHEGGRFLAEHIKYLRIVFASGNPLVLNRINGTVKLATDVLPLVNTMHNIHLGS